MDALFVVSLSFFLSVAIPSFALPAATDIVLNAQQKWPLSSSDAPTDTVFLPLMKIYAPSSSKTVLYWIVFSTQFAVSFSECFSQ